MPTKELLAEFLNTRSAVTEGQKHRRIFLRLFKSQIRFLSFLVILTNTFLKICFTSDIQLPRVRS